MMEEGFVVVALASTLNSIWSILKNRIMEKVTVGKNIVRAISKSIREYIFHGFATLMVFAAHLFMPGDAI